MLQNFLTVTSKYFMEYLKPFVNSVHVFYGNLEKQAVHIEKLLKDSNKYCTAVDSHCMILNAAIEKNSLEGTGLEKLPRFRELLTSGVLGSLQKDLDSLYSVKNEISEISDEILKNYKSVEKSYKILQAKNLVNSPLINPISPRLEHIVEWSLDVWRYYHLINLKTTIALENLNFKDKDSVDCILEAFKEDKELKQNIKRIRQFELHSFEFLE